MSELKHSVTKPPKKASSKVPAAPKQVAKPFKSAEFVEDSDDGQDPAVPGKTANPARPNKHRLSEKGPKQQAKHHLTPVTIIPSKKRKSRTPSASEIESSDAGSNSHVRSPTPKRPKTTHIAIQSNKNVARPKPAIAGLKKGKSESPISSQSESSESQSVEGTSQDLTDITSNRSNRPSSRKHQPSKTSDPQKRRPESEKSPSPVPTRAWISESESTDGSSDGTESESESGEDSGPKDKDKRKDSGPQNQQGAAKAPLLPYALPPGFEAVTISSQPTSRQAELFSHISLQGKQLWHITVPAGVSITSVTEVATQSVQDGSAILSYKGADYGLIAEPDDINSRERLLLPSAEHNKYKPSSLAITKTLHLQQLLGPPNIIHGPGALSNFTASTNWLRRQKPVPKQPEGLRMRYRPFGDTDGDTSSSDSGTQRMQQAQFRIPKGLETSSPAKKRKRDELEIPKHAESRNLKKPRKDGKNLAPSMPVINGGKASPVKESPAKHGSPSIEKTPKTKRREHNEPIRTTNSNHQREPSIAEESPSKPRSLPSDQRASIIPTSNNISLSATKSAPKDRSPNRKENPKKKHHGDQAVPTTAEAGKNQHQIITNGVPSRDSAFSGPRSDHQRDATAGAENSDKEVPVKDAKDSKAGEIQAPSSKKKSKHEGETAEEKAKRRAERKKRKELKATERL